MYNRRLPSSCFVLVLSALLLLTIGAPSSLHAQIQTDRPGFGDGTATVDARTLQVSAGYAYNSNRASLLGATYNSHELGQLLLRYGVIDGVEIRGGANSFVFTESPLENGYNGTSLGTKIRLFETQTMSVSGLASVGFPTGTGFFGFEDRFHQEIKVAADGALGESLTLTANAGARFFYDNKEELQWLFFPTVSYDVTESIGAYVGYAGFYTEDTTVNWVEGGATLLFDQNTQLDASVGVDIDSDRQPFFIGVGAARRF